MRDIYGEAADAVYLADSYGIVAGHQGWTDLTHVIDWLCEHWDQPDEGIWEVLDSSLLLMPLQGFIAPRDPMWLSTPRRSAAPASSSATSRRPSATCR